VGLTWLQRIASIAAICALLFEAAEAAGADPRPLATPGWDTTTSDFQLPDDPYLREQWWLYNFGQRIGGSRTGTAAADIRAPEAWAISRGAGVVVAVIDTGIDFEHPDLVGQTWTNPGESGDGRESNGIDDDRNGFIDDWRGWDFIDDDNDPSDDDTALGLSHGTAVAGVIAAKAANGYGIAGVAPEARIMAVRSVAPNDDAQRARAIDYAATMNADVIVLAYGAQPTADGTTSLTQAAIRDHSEVVFVVAAGNEALSDVGGATTVEPCATDTQNLVCVAASDPNDALASFTNRGPAVTLAAPGEAMIVLAAPREDILATHLERRETDDGWTSWTSLPSTGNADRATVQLVVSGTDERQSSTFSLIDDLSLRSRSDCALEFALEGSLQITQSITVRLYPAGSPPTAIDATKSLTAATPGPDGALQRVPLTPELLRVSQSTPLQLDLTLTNARQSSNADVQITHLALMCSSDTYNDQAFDYADGTSLAAPVGAGIAALILAVSPSLAPVQVIDALAPPQRHSIPRADALAALDRTDAIDPRLNPARTDQPVVADERSSPAATGLALPSAPHPVPPTRHSTDPDPDPPLAPHAINASHTLRSGSNGGSQTGLTVQLLAAAGLATALTFAWRRTVRWRGQR
jgi:subtilisin family serine protease